MTELTLEVGKYYRTQGGEKRGPMSKTPESWGFDAEWAFTDGIRNACNVWRGNGTNDDIAREDDLVAEWVDEPEEPKPWGALTDAEKGALLLADFNGEDIEFWYNETPGWQDCIGGQSPGKTENFAYRRKPEPKPEPTRETVICGWDYNAGITDELYPCDTHRITFDTIDGVPDCSTVRMEEVQ